MLITIYGASDDLVEVEGCKGAAEFDVYNSNGPLMWRGDLVAPDGSQMRLYGLYDGCWHFSIGQVDEAVKLPAWPLTIDQGGPANGKRAFFSAYSVLVSIDAPDGTRLTNTCTGERL